MRVERRRRGPPNDGNNSKTGNNSSDVGSNSNEGGETMGVKMDAKRSLPLLRRKDSSLR